MQSLTPQVASDRRGWLRCRWLVTIDNSGTSRDPHPSPTHEPSTLTVPCVTLHPRCPSSNHPRCPSSQPIPTDHPNESSSIILTDPNRSSKTSIIPIDPNRSSQLIFIDHPNRSQPTPSEMSTIPTGSLTSSQTVPQATPSKNSRRP